MMSEILRLREPVETPRLILRELTPDDAGEFYALNADPLVLRYTGDSPFGSVHEALKFLENYDQYQKYGTGRWAVLDKNGGIFLGWCGLKYHPDTGQHDLGFRFFREHWNKGYATEAGKASVDLGFGLYKMQTVIGRAMSENTASINVLKKCGFYFEKFCDFNGKEGVIYKIDSPV